MHYQAGLRPSVAAFASLLALTLLRVNLKSPLRFQVLKVAAASLFDRKTARGV